MKVVRGVVSIIIPVYNAERTIYRAIKGVRNQSYTNYEIIIIDDGSSDKTEKICRELQSGDIRIKYIRKKNGGAASARNIGLNRATGEFLAFLDADDAYHPDFLKIMVDSITKSQVDMAICGFTVLDGKNNIVYNQPIGNKSITLKNDLCRYLRLFFHGNPGGIASLWNKLYRRETIERVGLRLDEKKYHGEDWKFNLQLLQHGNISLVGVDKSLYNYIKQPASLSTMFFEDKLLQMFESAQLMLDINRQFNLNEETSVFGSLISGYVGVAKNLYNNSQIEGKKRQQLLRTLQKHPLMKISTSNIMNLPVPLKMKMLYLLHRTPIIGPGMFHILCNLQQK